MSKFGCFAKFKVNSFLGCVDHELGCRIIAYFLLAIDVVSLGLYAFLLSFMVMYWQVWKRTMCICTKRKYCHQRSSDSSLISPC